MVSKSCYNRSKWCDCGNFIEGVVKLVTVTSFLSDGLFNQLENTLRFGGVIIIQDCEYYDPLLDTVLRKEIHRNGGRMMIRLGDQIIDYSSDFKVDIGFKRIWVGFASIGSIKSVNYQLHSYKWQS